MSSSFQSTAATRIYDSPVNTFVQPVTAIQKSSMADLAEILQTVNPAITKFLVNKSNKKAEKDRKQAIADVLDAEINGGAIADLSNKIEKVEGRQAAREIIGGTRAYRRQYEKSLVALQAQKRGNRMDSDYDVTRIDTGAKDENGKPILKFLKEFSTDSNEYRTWRKSYLDEDLELFQQLGIDSTVVDDIYIPEMSKEMFKNANYGTKQNRAFEYNKFLGLMPDVLTEASLHLSKGEDDQAGEILNNYLENMYKGGITGTDATKTYTTLIENIYAQAEKLIDLDVRQPDFAKKLALAENFPDRLLSLVKYGDGDLTNHKDYLVKSAAFDEKFERLVTQKIKFKNEIQPQINKLEIKSRFKNLNNIPLTVDMTEQEKSTAIQNKRAEYEALKKDSKFTTKKEQDYIDQLGKSDNFELKSKLIPDLENKIQLGLFDGFDDDLEKAISDIENNHATMDNEAIKLIRELKTLAATSTGLADDIESSTTNIMDIVNDNLGTSDSFITRGFGENNAPDMVKATKTRFKVQKNIREYYKNYIKENGKKPSSLEIQAIEEQYAIQALAAAGQEDFELLRNQQYANVEDPFRDKKKKTDLIRKKPEIPIKDFDKLSEADKQEVNRILGREVFRQQNTNTNNDFMEKDIDLSNVEAGAFSGDSPTTVEVEQGDTLSELADQFGSSVQAIMEANNLTNPDMIRVGQELVMPIVERINMKEVKNNQIKALDVILKDTDKTKVIPQPKIEDMLLAVGFEPEIAKIMAAVAMAESAGDPMIDTVKSGLDPQKKKEFSIGLLQLNMKDDKDRLLDVFDIESEEELYDPIINVIAAKRLYDEQGLDAWGAYKNGSYKKFLKN